MLSVFITAFMGAMFYGGRLTNSLAIMTDAAHLLSDLLGVLFTIYGLKSQLAGPTNLLTYGAHRSLVVGALTSAILIWGLTIWLLYEAIWEFMPFFKQKHVTGFSGKPFDGKIMLYFAGISLGCNIFRHVVFSRKLKSFAPDMKVQGCAHDHGAVSDGGVSQHGNGGSEHSGS
jgi:cation diffusion facilitator family transporter